MATGGRPGQDLERRRHRQAEREVRRVASRGPEPQADRPPPAQREVLGAPGRHGAPAQPDRDLVLGAGDRRDRIALRRVADELPAGRDERREPAGLQEQRPVAAGGGQRALQRPLPGAGLERLGAGQGRDAPDGGLGVAGRPGRSAALPVRPAPASSPPEPPASAGRPTGTFTSSRRAADQGRPARSPAASRSEVRSARSPRASRAPPRSKSLAPPGSPRWSATALGVGAPVEALFGADEAVPGLDGPVGPAAPVPEEAPLEERGRPAAAGPAPSRRAQGSEAQSVSRSACSSSWTSDTRPPRVSLVGVVQSFATAQRTSSAGRSSRASRSGMSRKSRRSVPGWTGARGRRAERRPAGDGRRRGRQRQGNHRGEHGHRDEAGHRGQDGRRGRSGPPRRVAARARAEVTAPRGSAGVSRPGASMTLTCSSRSAASLGSSKGRSPRPRKTGESRDDQLRPPARPPGTGGSGWRRRRGARPLAGRGAGPGQRRLAPSVGRSGRWCRPAWRAAPAGGGSPRRPAGGGRILAPPGRARRRRPSPGWPPGASSGQGIEDGADPDELLLEDAGAGVLRPTDPPNIRWTAASS